MLPHGRVSDKGYKLILMKGVRGFYLKWREHDENTGKLQSCSLWLLPFLGPLYMTRCHIDCFWLCGRRIRHGHGSAIAQQRAPQTARAHLLVKIVDKASTDVKSKAAKSARPLSSTLEHENMLFSMTAACWRPLSAYEIMNEVHRCHAGFCCPAAVRLWLLCGLAVSDYVGFRRRANMFLKARLELF